MILDLASLRPTRTPEADLPRLGRAVTLHLSDAGGLRQFGVHDQTLFPGASTGRRHWHSAEDEFLYVLDGTEPATLFLIGSRFAEDACHYPDIDLHYSRRKGLRTLSHKDGTPYPGWPKETNR